MAQVAFAAGFASVRQFNDTVKAIFARTPTELRHAAARRERRGSGHHGRLGADGRAGAPQVLSVRLALRRPFDADELFMFLARRAIPGVEHGDGSCYCRSLRLPHGPASVELDPGDGHVEARFVLSELRDLSTAIARCRHLGNLDADPQAVDSALSEDPLLAPLVEQRPGLRVPGSADGFETAVRSVLGQQVTVAGARSLAAALVEAAGTALSPGEGGLRVFPSPEELGAVLSSPSSVVPLPASRRRALEALCDAVVSGRVVLDAGADPAEVTATLVSLPGIGPWTASAVALRALGDPDAFLVTDLGTRRAAAALGLPDAPAALAARAERWRPWRAYAQVHLWAHPATAAPTDTVDTSSHPAKKLDKESAA
jgi:AraC family transcriptional regulator of adaptative response / DNA-3-methyladenine glycosylase II